MKYLNQSNRIFKELFYAAKNMATPMKTCKFCDNSVTNSKLYRKLKSPTSEKYTSIVGQISNEIIKTKRSQFTLVFTLLANTVSTSNLIGRFFRENNNGTNEICNKLFISTKFSFELTNGR